MTNMGGSLTWLCKFPPTPGNLPFSSSEAEPPSFEERQGFLIVTFKTLPAGRADSVEDSQKGAQKSSEKSSEKILQLIKRNPAISARELAQRMGLTPRAVEK